MKLKSILCGAGLLLATGANAQQWKYDSVAMGAGYANDVFYNITDGTTKLISGSDWDLGFQMTTFGEPDLNATVRANHAKKGLEVYSLNRRASTDFASITFADTVGKTGLMKMLMNDESNWGRGAFFQNRLVADPFSYGWGEYTGPSSNHSVVGDSVYLVKVKGVPYKMWIQEYVSTPADSISYRFRIAKLDGTNDNTVKVYRKAGGYTDRLFGYYDITTNTFSDREPSRSRWDILFTQYNKIIPAGPGVFMNQVFTGVLGNQSMEIADVRNLPPDLANYATATYTKNVDEIGADWKTFDNSTFVYTLDDSASYFVKTKTSNEIYQIKFTRFDGGSPTAGGKIVFAKRYVHTVGVSNVAASTLNSWAVVPNPAASEASIMIDAKKAATAQLLVTDMAGRAMQNTTVGLKQGMNGFNLNTAAWPAGVYAVQVAGEGWKMSTRLVVAH